MRDGTSEINVDQIAIKTAFSNVSAIFRDEHIWISFTELDSKAEGSILT